MVTGFSSVEACDLADVTYRQLDYWARTGLVVPTVRARGSGTRRRYTLEEVQILSLVGKMTKIGVRFGLIRKSIELLRAELSTSSEGFLLFSEGDVRYCLDLSSVSIKEPTWVIPV